MAKVHASKELKDEEENPQNGDNDSVAVKLVIYDFDQTITEVHLYHELDGGQVDALQQVSDKELLTIFGGEERKQRLDIHFARVTSTAEIAIISFGWNDVIKEALKRIGFGKYFKNAIIAGADSEELKNAGSKAHLIAKMKKERDLKSNQVIFVDDDVKNVQKAMTYCQTIHIHPRTGMSVSHMQDVEKKCGVFVEEKLQNGKSENGKKKEADSWKNKYKPKKGDEFDKLMKKENNYEAPPVIDVVVEDAGTITPDPYQEVALVAPLGDILQNKLQDIVGDE